MDILYDSLLKANDIATLEQLLKKGNQESLNLEWKSTTRELTAAMQTLCAFLNNKGGIVFIGIKDNGQIIGQEVSDSTKRDIAAELQKFEPYHHIQVHYIPKSSTLFIIKLIASPEHMAIPYVYDGRPYDRYESSTRRMPQQRYEELLHQKMARAYPWDKQPARDVTLSDLDFSLIEQVWQNGILNGRVGKGVNASTPESILKRLKLLTDQGELTNAAAILFCKEMPSNYLNASIKLAAFNSPRKEHIIDSKTVNSNVFTLLKEADNFVRRNTPISSDFPSYQFERIDQPAYSFDALREAILNALCHRDYTISGAVSVMFYKDRLEITSHGSLPFGLTIEEIRISEESFPRNELIANTLYFCGEIESLGRGIQKIFEEAEKVGMELPRLETSSHTFKVIFTALEPLPLKKEREQSKVSIPGSITQRQKSILTLLASEKSMSPRQLLQQLPSISERTLRRELAQLAQLGLVYSQGKGVATVWQLTESGH